MSSTKLGWTLVFLGFTLGSALALAQTPDQISKGRYLYRNPDPLTDDENISGDNFSCETNKAVHDGLRIEFGFSPEVVSKCRIEIVDFLNESSKKQIKAEKKADKKGRDINLNPEIENIWTCNAEPPTKKFQAKCAGDDQSCFFCGYAQGYFRDRVDKINGPTGENAMFYELNLSDVGNCKIKDRIKNYSQTLNTILKRAQIKPATHCDEQNKLGSDMGYAAYNRDVFSPDPKSPDEPINQNPETTDNGNSKPSKSKDSVSDDYPSKGGDCWNLMDQVLQKKKKIPYCDIQSCYKEIFKNTCDTDQCDFRQCVNDYTSYCGGLPGGNSSKSRYCAVVPGDYSSNSGPKNADDFSNQLDKTLKALATLHQSMTADQWAAFQSRFFYAGRQYDSSATRGSQYLNDANSDFNNNCQQAVCSLPNGKYPRSLDTLGTLLQQIQDSDANAIHGKTNAVRDFGIMASTVRDLDDLQDKSGSASRATYAKFLADAQVPDAAKTALKRFLDAAGDLARPEYQLPNGKLVNLNDALADLPKGQTFASYYMNGTSSDSDSSAPFVNPRDRFQANASKGNDLACLFKHPNLDSSNLGTLQNRISKDAGYANVLVRGLAEYMIHHPNDYDKGTGCTSDGENLVPKSTTH